MLASIDDVNCGPVVDIILEEIAVNSPEEEASILPREVLSLTSIADELILPISEITVVLETIKVIEDSGPRVEDCLPKSVEAKDGS